MYWFGFVAERRSGTEGGNAGEENCAMSGSSGVPGLFVLGACVWMG